MKKSFLIIFIFLIISCDSNKSSKKLSTIEYSEIQIAEIRKSLYDTLSVDLNRFHIARIVNIINSSEKAELLKAYPKFWVFIKLKNNSILAYKIIDGKIGENDLYVDVEDKDYFKKLYEKNRKSKSRITK